MAALHSLGYRLTRFANGTDTFLPVLSLFIRLWIAYIFFASGLTKIQSWNSTLFLFENEYDVPFLPFEMAAVLGTAAELILPILLVLGLGTRLVAIALFIFNVVAVYAYRSYLYDVGYAGLVAHFYWGFLMLIILIQGPGPLSLDYILSTSLNWQPFSALGRLHSILLGIGGLLVSAVFLSNVPVMWDSATFWSAIQWQTTGEKALIGYLGMLVTAGFVAYSLWHSEGEGL